MALLPVTLYVRSYFAEGVLPGIVRMIRDFLFNSTFRASWFIMAMVISTILVYLLSFRMNNLMLFLLGLVVFILVSLRSSYYQAGMGGPVITAVVNGYERFAHAPQTSFPAAFFWIVCGKYFAEGVRIKISRALNLALIVIFAALLFAEWKYVEAVRDYSLYDSYLSLAPLCLSIFNLILNLKPVNNPKTIILRRIVRDLFRAACGGIQRRERGISASSPHSGSSRRSALHSYIGDLHNCKSSHFCAG